MIPVSQIKALLSHYEDRSDSSEAAQTPAFITDLSHFYHGLPHKENATLTETGRYLLARIIFENAAETHTLSDAAAATFSEFKDLVLSDAQKETLPYAQWIMSIVDSKNNSWLARTPIDVFNFLCAESVFFARLPKALQTEKLFKQIWSLGSHLNNAIQPFVDLPEALQTKANLDKMKKLAGAITECHELHGLIKAFSFEQSHLDHICDSPIMYHQNAIIISRILNLFPTAQQTQDKFTWLCHHLDRVKEIYTTIHLWKTLPEVMLAHDSLDLLYETVCCLNSLKRSSRTQENFNFLSQYPLGFSTLLDAVAQSSHAHYREHSLSYTFPCTRWIPEQYSTHNNGWDLLKHACSKAQAGDETTVLNAPLIFPWETSVEGMSAQEVVKATQADHVRNAKVIAILKGAEDPRDDFECFLRGFIFSGQMPGWGLDKGFCDPEYAESCLRQISKGSPFSKPAHTILQKLTLQKTETGALHGLSLFAQNASSNDQDQDACEMLEPCAVTEATAPAKCEM